jgi:carboxypeptidase Taq
MNTDFVDETARLADVLGALNLLAWDARTKMPIAGSTARGHQVSTLTGLARDIATGSRLRDGLAAAQAAVPEDEDEAALLASFARQLSALDRVPKAVLVELAGLGSTAHAAWVAARETNDFGIFAPPLTRIFALQRELAEAIGYEEHPYDALIDRFEPGMTRARLKPLLASLRAGIMPLVDALRDSAPAGSLTGRRFPLDGQRRFAAAIAAKLGYDFRRGRVDDTVHPFEISMTREDVRITTRFREDDPRIGLFGLWHEAGHGIYEQNVSTRWTRGIGSVDLPNLYSVGGGSFGLHESQSRLYENRIGRSRRFWELHYGALRDVFPEQLEGVPMDAFWRAVNAPRIGLIRTEADELTYDAHVMLRVELEAALISGEIDVADLPAIWDERMMRDFGLAVPDLARGVLQDVHWSSGYVGSFATYTLGNIMSSQFFAAANGDEAVSAGLRDGDYAPLTAWLGEHVHRHGRSRGRERLLRDATGHGLDPGPYLADLQAKAEALA